MEVARDQVILSIRNFLMHREIHYNSCQETEKALKSLREEKSILDGILTEDGKNTNSTDTDEVRLWAKQLENALYRGLHVFNNDAEIELFLQNYNALKLEEFRAQLEKNKREHCASILAISEEQEESNRVPDEPYDEVLLKDTSKVYTELFPLSQSERS
ncbi:unnamed protein product [Oikopleura dioica]|uniref:Uncharacterized protein n=1 Tax=Oikopleura dioica TaxID=34765 RepID=E4YZ63_OIKDI|nr:unnamed protein product [Oikopleura dioica]